MSDVANTATFQRAITALQALEAQGVQFKVIVGDQQWGKLEVAQAKRTKRHYMFSKVGAKTAYLDPFLKDVTPGQLVIVPKPEHIGEKTSLFAQSIANHCYRTWGKGTFMISSNGDNVEVLRTK